MDPTWKQFAESSGHFHRKPRLPDPARPRNCNQPHIRTHQQFFGGLRFLFSPYKTSPRHRQVRWPRLRLLTASLRKTVSYRRKFLRKIARGRVPLISLLGQTSLDGPAQRRRGLPVLRSDRLGLFLQNRYKRLRSCASPKRVVPGHHLIKHQAKRKLVRPEIQHLSVGLLR